jgi:hypothetical protein
MKRTIMVIVGFALFAASATMAQAQTGSVAGDDIFFSQSNTNPGATVGDSTFNFNATGTQTLYVWITMVPTASDPDGGATNGFVSPADTGFTNGFPNTGAGLAVNYANSSAAVAALTAASVTNPTLTGSSPATTRWDNTTSFSSSGTQNIYNVNAVTVPVASPAGINRGLSNTNIGGVSDPNTSSQAFSNGATKAFLLGSINVNVLGAGSTVVSVQPSNQAANSGLGIPAGLKITKGVSGSGTSTDMTGFFTYHSATLNVTTGRLGDLNNDGAINALDIDILAGDIRNNTTNIATEDLNGDNVVNSADLDNMVGVRVDINGGGVGGAHGTHYGDLDLSGGSVNGSDLLTLLQHFGNTGAQAIWANGNLYNNPNNTSIGGEDLLLLLQKFGNTGPTPGPSPVPEPSSFALLGLGIASILAIRRRGR